MIKEVNVSTGTVFEAGKKYVVIFIFHMKKKSHYIAYYILNGRDLL